MENIKNSLEFLGFEDEEIEIYLTLLEYGTLPVSRLSDLTKIPRVNSYYHLEKMVEKGIVHQSEKSKIKQFGAEPPAIFLNQAQEKLNLAESLVPELLALNSYDARKPKVQFFEGKEGLKNIFRSMITPETKEIVSFSNFEELSAFAPEFLRSHFKDRLKSNIKTRFISARSAKAQNFKSDFFPACFDEKLVEIFLMSAEEFCFDSQITIFPGSIAIMNLSADTPIGILIENQELYQTQKTIFDLAWLGATSFITQ